MSDFDNNFRFYAPPSALDRTIGRPRHSSFIRTVPAVRARFVVALIAVAVLALRFFFHH